MSDRMKKSRDKSRVLNIILFVIVIAATYVALDLIPMFSKQVEEFNDNQENVETVIDFSSDNVPKALTVSSYGLASELVGKNEYGEELAEYRKLMDYAVFDNYKKGHDVITTNATEEVAAVLRAFANDNMTFDNQYYLKDNYYILVQMDYDDQGNLSVPRTWSAEGGDEDLARKIISAQKDIGISNATVNTTFVFALTKDSTIFPSYTITVHPQKIAYRTVVNNSLYFAVMYGLMAVVGLMAVIFGRARIRKDGRYNIMPFELALLGAAGSLYFMLLGFEMFYSFAVDGMNTTTFMVEYSLLMFAIFYVFARSVTSLKHIFTMGWMKYRKYSLCHRLIWLSKENTRGYKALNSATMKLSEGNLHPEELDGEMGVYNPIRDNLCHVADAFSQAVSDEMKSERMKRELITNVSHDLKTPLTAITTYVELLKDENLSSEKRAEYIDILERKSLRLKAMIDDLFDVSKATSETMALEMTDINVCSLVKQVAAEMSEELGKKKLEVKYNMPESFVVSLDGAKAYRIFENLFGNICKYALPGTRVYVELEGRTISISNISETELNFSDEEITERFVRGDVSRNTEGSGLGLAIVKSFTEAMGGSFKIKTDGDMFKAFITW